MNVSRTNLKGGRSTMREKTAFARNATKNGNNPKSWTWGNPREAIQQSKKDHIELWCRLWKKSGIDLRRKLR